MQTVAYGRRHDQRQAIGNWIGSYDWDWYATFTFRYDVTPEVAMQRVIEFLERWDCNVEYFIVAEWHRFRQCAHVHCLIKGLKLVRSIFLMSLWKRRKYGNALIKAYHDGLGANYYVTKFVMSSYADWTFRMNPKPDETKDKPNGS